MVAAFVEVIVQIYPSEYTIGVLFVVDLLSPALTIGVADRITGPFIVILCCIPVAGDIKAIVCVDIRI
ncbi:hypothetical protein D3C81_758080 [compost metagenome]